jgi:hypothetical protein
MKKISLLLAAAIIATGSLSAQVFKRQKHELSVHAGVGMSTLQYDLQAGKQKNGIGFQIGGGYAFFFMPNVALRTGIELNIYNSSASLNGFTDSYEVPGSTVADNYTYYYALDKYNESQQALYLNIPLMLQFQTGRTYIFYGAVGGKVGFPLGATSRTKKYDLSTKGYFPREGRTYDDLPQFGFGTYEYLKKSTGLDNLQLHYMLAAEAGLKWKILKGNDLYTGFYVDYGLNNIQSTNDKTFVKSALTADKPAMSPLIESKYAGSPFTEKITPLAVGLKVRFTFMQ